MFLIKNMLCIYFSADHSFTNHGNGHVRLERQAEVDFKNAQEVEALR